MTLPELADCLVRQVSAHGGSLTLPQARAVAANLAQILKVEGLEGITTCQECRFIDSEHDTWCPAKPGAYDKPKRHTSTDNPCPDCGDPMEAGEQRCPNCVWEYTTDQPHWQGSLDGVTWLNCSEGKAKTLPHSRKVPRG